MNKLTVLLLLIATGTVMACDSSSTLSEAKAKVSKPASTLKPAEKIENDDVRTVPNQFPLKDGVLPKPEQKEKKNTTKKNNN